MDPDEAQALYQWRLDAWRHIYNTEDGCDPEAFWEAVHLSRRRPERLQLCSFMDEPAGVLQLDEDRYGGVTAGHISLLPDAQIPLQASGGPAHRRGGQPLQKKEEKRSGSASRTRTCPPSSFMGRTASGRSERSGCLAC